MTTPKPETIETYTTDQVAARVHKSKDWLQGWLKGRAIGRMAGRTKLFTEMDIEKIRLSILQEAIDKVGRPISEEGGQIYFVEAGDFIKIGFTRSPESRAQKMLTDSPHEIKVLHIEPGTFKQEKVFHRHFAALRVRGEWFHKNVELLEFIEERKRISRGAA